MAQKIAKRGYVLVRLGVTGKLTVSAILQKTEAQALKHKFGGTLVPASGMAYRMAQKTLRVVIDKEEAIRRAEAIRSGKVQ